MWEHNGILTTGETYKAGLSWRPVDELLFRHLGQLGLGGVGRAGAQGVGEVDQLEDVAQREQRVAPLLQEVYQRLVGDHLDRLVDVGREPGEFLRNQCRLVETARPQPCPV